MKTYRIVTLVLLIGLFSFLKEVEGKVVSSLSKVWTTIQETKSFDVDYSSLDLSYKFKTTRTISVSEFFGD